MEDVCPVLHEPDVHGGGVSALSVGDGVCKPILELSQCPEKVRLHETHHGMVWGVGRETFVIAVYNRGLYIDYSMLQKAMN